MDRNNFSSLNQIGSSECNGDNNNNIGQINTSFTIDIEKSTRTNLEFNTRKKNVRLIYCGDGVVEECDEDEEEKKRLEEEAKQKEIEERQKMDLEAKNLNWIPWVGYMVSKSASKSLEVCDTMGEKLAWWLGITKPKFLYEIEEYNRMKQEEEDMFKDDQADEIVVGVETIDKIVENNNNECQPNDVEMKLFDQRKKF